MTQYLLILTNGTINCFKRIYLKDTMAFYFQSNDSLIQFLTISTLIYVSFKLRITIHNSTRILLCQCYDCTNFDILKYLSIRHKSRLKQRNHIYIMKSRLKPDIYFFQPLDLYNAPNLNFQRIWIRVFLIFLLCSFTKAVNSNLRNVVACHFSID